MENLISLAIAGTAAAFAAAPLAATAQNAGGPDAAPADAAAFADFGRETGMMRPELHSSGFGPLVCSCSKSTINDIRAMGFKASRTHDWALLNSAERVCDYYHIFPLPHLDAKDPANYVFGPTDYLLSRTRDELGHDIFYRLGTSIEHSGDKVHFNSLIPEDFDKVAETFAGTIRHFNKGWANGHEWGIKYWEIWNEPDGVNNMWCLPDGDGDRGATDPAAKADYGERSKRRRDLFCRFFVTCLKRIKAEFPDVKVGGPALCSMSPGYFTALFEACKEAGVAPDFISWHHYTKDPESIMNAIERGRALCDQFGFTDCELVIDEWHFFGEYGWGELRSSNPEVKRRVWSGPASHNGIDSSCFNLTMLSKFQTSKLDQAFYYGCRHNGSWGYKDEFGQKYKVFYGLKIFGGLVKNYPVLCASGGTGGVTVLAAKSADGSRKALLVTDYRSGRTELSVKVEGVAPDAECQVTIHDNERNEERVKARLVGGCLDLPKRDANSAAFLVEF